MKKLTAVAVFLLVLAPDPASRVARHRGAARRARRCQAGVGARSSAARSAATTRSARRSRGLHGPGHGRTSSSPAARPRARPRPHHRGPPVRRRARARRPVARLHVRHRRTAHAARRAPRTAGWSRSCSSATTRRGRRRRGRDRVEPVRRGRKTRARATSSRSTWPTIFQWDVDFNTEIQPGDTFRVVVEKQYLDGRLARYGRILAAEFVRGQRVLRAVRHEGASGAGYYEPDGTAAAQGVPALAAALHAHLVALQPARACTRSSACAGRTSASTTRPRPAPRCRPPATASVMRRGLGGRLRQDGAPAPRERLRDALRAPLAHRRARAASASRRARASAPSARPASPPARTSTTAWRAAAASSTRCASRCRRPSRSPRRSAPPSTAEAQRLLRAARERRTGAPGRRADAARRPWLYAGSPRGVHCEPCPVARSRRRSPCSLVAAHAGGRGEGAGSRRAHRPDRLRRPALRGARPPRAPGRHEGLYDGPAPRQLVTLTLHDRTPRRPCLSVLEGLGVNFALVWDETGARAADADDHRGRSGRHDRRGSGASRGGAAAPQLRTALPGGGTRRRLRAGTAGRAAG